MVYFIINYFPLMQPFPNAAIISILSFFLYSGGNSPIGMVRLGWNTSASVTVRCRMLNPAEVVFVSCSLTCPLCGTLCITFFSQLLPRGFLLHIIKSLLIMR